MAPTSGPVEPPISPPKRAPSLHHSKILLGFALRRRRADVPVHRRSSQAGTTGTGPPPWGVSPRSSTGLALGGLHNGQVEGDRRAQVLQARQGRAQARQAALLLRGSPR